MATRPQNKNLILKGEAHKLSVEEASRGGKASGESRRRKKGMKETFEALLSVQTSERFKTAFKKQGIDIPDNLTNEQALAISMMAKAIAGDARMASLIFDVTGEKTNDKLRAKEVEIKEKEVALKERIATDTKNEAIDRLDAILKGLRDEAYRETE